MAESAPAPTAPQDLTVAYTSVANQVGTFATSWVNRSGGAYPSYGRVDLQVRNKATPAAIITLRTWSPYTGINSATVTRTGSWSASSAVEWEFRVVASANGKTADSGWKAVAPLVTTKPTITSVERISEVSAWVYFSPPAAGIAAPTSANVARSVQGQTAGSSSPVNNTTLPAALNRIHLPIPAGTAPYDAWLRFAGPAGLSLPEKRTVPGWWSQPEGISGLTATRQASNRANVAIAFTYSGADGKAATSFLIEWAPKDTDTWRTLTTLAGTARSFTTSVPMAGDRRFRVTAINPAGRGSAQTVTVDPWWQPVPAATDVSVSRTASGQGRLAWTVPTQTSRNPVRSQRIYRAPREGGDFVLIATLNATVRGWTDATTTSMSRYRYQVRTVGDMGEATSYTTVNLDSAWSEPAAPTSTSVTRNASNPDAFDISFTVAESEARPVDWIDILTRTPSGTVAVAASHRRTTLDASDTVTHTAGPNVVVEYGVRARNGAGISDPVTWSTPQSTTPRGASAFSARRIGADVGLYWTVDGSTIADGWDIERSPDSGANWFPLALSGITGSSRTATHGAAALSVGHDYRIRPRRAGAPVAAWVRVEAAIPDGAQPLAPVLREPAWGALGEPIAVEWEHRPQDGTPQAAAVVEWESRSAADVVIASGSVSVGAVSSVSLPASTITAVGQTLRTRVATRGTGSSTLSPFTEWRTRSFATRPSVSVSVPVQVESQTLEGVFTTSDAWVSATIRLLDTNGAVLATRVNTARHGTTFSFPVSDRLVGSVEVVIHDGRLESAPAVAPFEVVWRRPAPPRLSAAVVATDTGEQVELSVFAPAGLRITRRRVDGAYTGYDDYSENPAHFPVVTQITLTESDGTQRSGLHMMRWDENGGGGLEWEVDEPDPGETVLGVVTLTTLREYSVNNIPIWPEVETRILPVVDGKVRVGFGGRDELVILDFAVIATAEDPPDWTPFDGDTDPGDHPAAIPGTIVPGETVPGATVHYGWLPDGTAYEAVEAESPAEADIVFPPPVRIELIRITDGVEHSLGDAVDNRGRDPWPRFCKPELFIARAWGDNGAFSDSLPVAVTVEQRDMVVNAGPDLALRVTAGPRDDLPITGGTVTKTVRPTVGRAPLVFTGTTPSPREATVRADLWQHHSDLADWVAAHNAAGDALLRDPSGAVMLGQLIVDTRHHRSKHHRSLSFRFIETGPRP